MEPHVGLELLRIWKPLLDPSQINFKGEIVSFYKIAISNIIKLDLTETDPFVSPFRPLAVRRSKAQNTTAEIKNSRKHHRNAYLRLFYDIILPKLKDSIM